MKRERRERTNTTKDERREGRIQTNIEMRTKGGTNEEETKNGGK